jgi:hypothetical protein
MANLSIYSGLLQRNEPSQSYGDVQKDIESIRSAKLSNQGAQAQMQESERRRRMAAIMPAMESLASMTPEQRRAEFPKVQDHLIRSGALSPDQAVPEFDDNSFQHNWGMLQKSPEYREAQKQMAETELIQAKAKAAVPDAELDRAYKRAQIGNLNSEAKARLVPKGFKKELDPQTGEDKIVPIAKTLPADKVLSVNQGNTIPGLLKDVRNTVEGNTDQFGPVSGRLSAMNPWNEKAKTMDAQMRISAQNFGKYMEGGVLRKEDEIKYREMFPNLSDTPEVANNKLALVERMLAEKQNSDVKALKDQGYDVSGVEQRLDVRDVPSVLAGGVKKSGDLIPSAQANDSTNFREVNGKLYKKVKGGWVAI